MCLNNLRVTVTSLILITAVGCTNQVDKSETKSATQTILQEVTSPLDLVVGDKIVNAKTGKIRGNNFKSLIGKDEKILLKKSRLYTIDKLDSNLYLIRQNSKYYEARLFNLLIKTRKEKISDYLCINDLAVINIQKDLKNQIILLSDFEHNENIYWKTGNKIKILLIDNNFKELWSYVRKSNNYPLSGKTIDLKKDKYTFHIEVITGCHICLNVVELHLSKTGKFISAKVLEKQNSEKILGDAELRKIFH